MDLRFVILRMMFVVLFSLVTPVHASMSLTYVARTIDGDSILVKVKRKTENLRLFGIDAPEIGQEFGTEARDFVRERTAGRAVTVERLGSDRFGRDVAIVRLPDGRSLNAELVRQGYAWWSRRHAPDDLELAKAEHDARAAKRGLWQQSEPVSPWVWRAAHANRPFRSHDRFGDPLEHVR
jgi:endonuclease YncB( thermonuclease family)